MRKFILLCLAACSSLAFITKENYNDGKITTPPGTVMLKEGLFIDKYEVSNGEWKEFTDGWIMGVDDDSALYQKMLPDSLVWVSLKFDADMYIESYYKGSNFNNYPVVGISYEQAKAFCEWRTDRVNEYLEKSRSATFTNVEYRLPTEAEWELAASGKLDTTKFPYGYENITKKNKEGDIEHLLNCVYKDGDSVNIIQNLPLPIGSSAPNAFGIFNLIGNVGEMTATEGLAKGGHYDLPLEYCKIKEKMSYKSPNRWLGFRCVCQITNKNAFSSKENKKEKKSKPVKGKKGKGFVNEEQNN